MSPDSASLRHRGARPPLAALDGRDGAPSTGVGPGIGLALLRALFPLAKDRIRVASAYFTLSGYRIARESIGPDVRIEVLVGKEDGTNVRQAVITEIADDLARADLELWDAVADVVERMRRGLFTIRDARRVDTPFHCKFYVCDDVAMWHGSANYTQNGLKVNAEQASATRDSAEIELFTSWYDQVAADAVDLLAELRALLEAWLCLATPFDAYLATIYRLYGLDPLEMAPEAHPPVYYQSAIVARAIRQIEEYRGAVAVVATGLGKTIIGAETAGRLHASGRATRVILVAPASVHEDWRLQLAARRVTYDAFTSAALFRRKTQQEHHQPAKLEAQLRLADSQTLIILDEAHFARNQILAQHATGRPSRVFRRLSPALRGGARVLLLTATPYGTSPKNLESLLRLLPDTRPGGLGIPVAWTAERVDEFVGLPVVSVLGFPHLLSLARTRGDVDAARRPFVQFAAERRYLPRLLKLRWVEYRPVLATEIEAAFNEGCFAQAARIPHVFVDDDGEIRKGLTDSVTNSTIAAWLSSPPALLDSLERNVTTAEQSEQLEVAELTASSGSALGGQMQLPLVWRNAVPGAREPRAAAGPVEKTGAGLGYATAMLKSQESRAEILAPLITRLQELPADEDQKLQQLAKLVWKHCITDGQKAIVFVRKPRTALYLESELRRSLGSSLSVASTACEREAGAHLKSALQRTELRRRFSPGSHSAPAGRDRLDVLICTDADAEGVNLQDARVVINYDLPDGGDTLFQRAGRVLRLTADADRVVHFYTLIPRWSGQAQWTSRVQQQVEQGIGRLFRRHARSASILQARILPEGTGDDWSMDIDLDMEDFLRAAEADHGWMGVSAPSPADHHAVLEQHMVRAQALKPPLQSAREYDGAEPRMFVLLQHGDVVVPLVFNPGQEKLEVRTDLEALSLIACGPDERRAEVAGAEVERCANLAIRKWCERSEVEVSEVRKICAIYLHPRGQRRGLVGILGL